MTLNFQKQKLINELRKIKPKPKRVLVQLPEGIKQNSSEIKEIIEKTLPKTEVIFSGETCWGGCALAINEAKQEKCDLIIHFGHSEFFKQKQVKVIYIEVKDELNPNPILIKSLKYLKPYKKVGFSCSVQHIHDIKKITGFYKKNNKQIILSKKIGNVNYPGQILGCQYNGLKAIEKDVGCFLILGNRFHAIGALLSLNKPVILLDVYNDKIETFDDLKNKILKQRAIAIDKFRHAKKIGVLVEVKPGQRFGSEKILVNKLKKAEKDFIIISINEITPEKLMNFYNLDAFVKLACPRIAIDDSARYPKPILTLKEAMVALNEKSWDELLKEGIL